MLTIWRLVIIVPINVFTSKKEIFSENYEVNASEYLENLYKMFPQYFLSTS